MADSTPLHVALLLPSLKFGGAERVAVNLAKALKECGMEVDLLLMSYEGEFLDEAEKNFNVVNLKCNKTYKLPYRLLAYFSKQRPNVLLSSFWKLNLCACLAKMLFPSLNLLLWEHSPPSKSKNSPKWLYAVTASVAYQFANKVVAVSTGVYNDVDRWTCCLRRKLIVIFNPITPPDPRLISQPRSSQTKQVVWVGRLDGPKNPMLALEAFALLPEDADINLVFVGDGPLRVDLENRCRELGLCGRVKLLGYHEQPYAVMSVSNLLLLSSDREGLPSVLVEALFSGLRVVATDCGKGIHDILLDNQYGSIVPCNDKFSMAKSVENELKTYHAAQDQINGAQRFLPQVVVQQFLAAMH